MHPALVNLLILAASLLILAFFSELTVRNGVKLSKLLGISELAIGFILISVLTSLPELMVTINSSAADKLGLSVGNIFGSNVVDIALVLGLGFFLYPKVLKGKQAVRKISSALLLTSAIMILFLLTTALSRLMGLALIITFFYFCYTLIRQKPRLHEAEVLHSGPTEQIVSKISRLHMGVRLVFEGSHLGAKAKETATALLVLLGSTVGIIVSSGFVVSSGVGLAESLGLAKSIVGAVLVAFGTSVPELSVELASLRRGHIGLAMGDAIGSTVTNITLIFGIGLLISPAPVIVSFFPSLFLFMLLTNLVFWNFLSGQEFGRKQGAILIAIYAAFLAFLFAEQIYALRAPLLAFLGGLF